MKYRIWAPVLVLFPAAWFLLAACRPDVSPDLERIRLFSIPYGRFDGEIDLFTHTTGGVCPEVCFFMRDGIFYVGNASAKKVLQFTSYGDLLSVYYNPEAVPAPSFSTAGTDSGENAVRTQKAVAYPFNRISAVAVDSEKRMLVADALPSERAEYNEEEELMLENIVVRFDAAGQFLDYIGQEGAGGTPFPPLSGIFLNAEDELFVVARKQDGMEVFWYDAGGRLLYRVPVSQKTLPSPYPDGQKSILSLSDVFPARRGDTLYFKLDCYREVVDSETGSASGIAFDRSVLYPFSVRKAEFGAFLELPVYEDTGGNASLPPVLKPYGVLGITENGRLFLYSPVARGYEICIADLHSGRIQRRTLPVDYADQVYNVFHLSEDGILSAVLAGAGEAAVVWWRTDALTGDSLR